MAKLWPFELFTLYVRDGTYITTESSSKLDEVDLAKNWCRQNTGMGSSVPKRHTNICIYRTPMELKI